ncbi:hypothetical protein [Edaphocola aurantiacus]|uniref:hypothetical protein n=1 Tax=Edaphocola aurantiacus TaxID=2601682 RepID=UPI001C980291|nr:hypothetical protein [Edaphocola aurantiacus]
MKRTLIMLAITGVMALASCHKPIGDNPFNDEKLESKLGATNVTVSCPPTVLSGTISTNTTLTTGTSYLLSGNVVVDGATLTIQPGVVVMGEKSSNGALIIKPNAQISAVGTITSPIVFTSDQAAGSRAAGDWFGVAILGNAPNNQSNSINLTINSSTFNFGGPSSASSSGNFEYVQIHYAGAGGGSSDVLTESSLILGSVGSGMTVKNVQISNSLKDGLGVWGGEAGVKKVFTHKISRSDFRMSQGYRGNVQNIFGFKDDASTTVTTIPSLEVSNYLRGSNNSPFTYPTISNASLLGGSYCASGDTDFKTAVLIRNNGDARIYNSVIEGFSQYGLYLDDAGIVAKTASGTDQLQFSHNSILSSATVPYGNGLGATTWFAAGGCSANSLNTMTDWLTAGPPPSCRESGNQINGGIVSGYYNSSLCGDKCSSFPNLYINTSTSDLDVPDYSMLGAFFDQPDYRGALQSSMDTWLVNTWIDFCQQTRNYCL